MGGREPYLHFAGIGWRELRDPGSGRSTLAALLRVCGLAPARAPVEDTGWLGAIGRDRLERRAFQRPGRVRRVAVLGAISMPERGLFLQALATDARERDLPLRFAIAGFSDPALTGGLERAGVTETGRYSADDPTLDRPARAALQIAQTDRHWEDDEILDLVGRVSADLVLLPAIWPETYPYALTLALRTGLPVAACDLGAPGERLRTYPNGHLLPYALPSDPAALNDRLLTIDISQGGRLSGPIQAAEYGDLMRDYYGLDPAPGRSEFKERIAGKRF